MAPNRLLLGGGLGTVVELWIPALIVKAHVCHDKCVSSGTGPAPGALSRWRMRETRQLEGAVRINGTVGCRCDVQCHVFVTRVLRATAELSVFDRVYVLQQNSDRRKAA